MPSKFTAGKRAISECDICGFRFKLSVLRKLVVKTKIVAIKACPSCWSPDHPQLLLGMYPVSDPQAVRDPRPDFAGYAESRAQLITVYSMAATGFVGNVAVTTA